jgi:hypothetical protein
MALLNLQGMLYLGAGALVLVLGRRARPSRARRRKADNRDGLAVGRSLSRGSSES